MSRAISVLVLAGLLALAGLSFAGPGMAGPIIWAVLAGFVVLGGLVWLRDRRGRDDGN